MRTALRAGVLFAAVAAASVSTAADDGFTPLFNGKDLTGWKPYLKDAKADPKNTWSVVDGAIVCTGKPNGYIATEKEYADYVLRLKWRFPAGSKGGNSGVLLHVQEKDAVWPTSIEAQLFAGSAGDFWLIYPPDASLDVDKARQDPKQARHYYRLMKGEKIERPFGEWNQYEITCKGGDVTLVVNGQKVNEGKNGNLKKGRIALQSEGAEVHFKDIEIKEMK
jgi:hypothetical protein